MVQTWSGYTNELPNILFNQMFTFSSCAGQNVASVMDTFRENCPDERSYKDLKERMNNDDPKGQMNEYEINNEQMNNEQIIIFIINQQILIIFLSNYNVLGGTLLKN